MDRAAAAALLQDTVEEDRVAEQVAPPHTARLDRQAEDPLEPVVRHPMRRALDAPGDVLEQGADGPDDLRVDLVEVALYPHLLLRGPHPHEQDVRLLLVDVLEHTLLVRAVL